MLEVKTKIKKWGNSLATIIPNDIVEKANLKANTVIRLFLPFKKIDLNKEFGSLKEWKKPTAQIMREIDKGW